MPEATPKQQADETMEEERILLKICQLLRSENLINIDEEIRLENYIRRKEK